MGLVMYMYMYSGLQAWNELMKDIHSLVCAVLFTSPVLLYVTSSSSYLLSQQLRIHVGYKGPVRVSYQLRLMIVLL